MLCFIFYLLGTEVIFGPVLKNVFRSFLLADFRQRHQWYSNQLYQTVHLYNNAQPWLPSIVLVWRQYTDRLLYRGNSHVSTR